MLDRSLKRFIGPHALEQLRNRANIHIQFDNDRLSKMLEDAVDQAEEQGLLRQGMHEGKQQIMVDITDTLSPLFGAGELVAILKSDDKNPEREAVVTVRPKRPGEFSNPVLTSAQAKEIKEVVQAPPTQTKEVRSSKSGYYFWAHFNTRESGDVTLTSQDHGTKAEMLAAWQPRMRVFKEIEVEMKLEVKE